MYMSVSWYFESFGRVVPIFKSGLSMEVKNYRPIPVLSFFSEKLIYAQIPQ